MVRFGRSRNSQDRSWSASKTQAGRLIRLFGGAIDAMVRAREYDRDPFDVLDEEIGWDRLVASREEIAALGDLATQDPLSLATQRYAQLRRFAPAFLEAFEFDAPASGQGLWAAVTLLRELNRTGKRNLPDIVPMPFPSQHWKTVILHNATPQRRTYETAVVATLRDRLRAGDIWVEGSRDYRRFDAYLVPMDETQRVLGDSTLETDGPAWLTGRRERLHDRLREVRAKLAAGRLEVVRLENSRLKITPYDPLGSSPLSFQPPILMAKLLRDGGHSYHQSKHLIAKPRRRVGLTLELIYSLKRSEWEPVRTIDCRIISRHSKQREDCFQKAVIKRGLRCMRRSALRARSFSSP